MAATPLRVYLQTLGCKVNRVESETIASQLQRIGVSLSASLDDADVVVINTCSVTGEADAKTRKAVRKAAHIPSVRLVVPTGCAAALHEKTLSELDECVRVCVDKTAVADMIVVHFGLDVSSASEAATGMTSGAGALVRDHEAFRTRASVKVQDGCENFCSYCIVPYARGERRSTPVAEVVETVRGLVAAGTREIVLTGINIGEYRSGDADFIQLIRALLDQTDIYRVRISSIEPVHVIDAFIQLLADEPRICSHLHIPLQSGSDAVLKSMNRRYEFAEFAEMVARLRAVRPEIAITTDIIVGYPTETDVDFEQSVHAINQLQLSGAHIFRFSPREGTPAAELPPVSHQVSEHRASLLRALTAQAKTRYQASRHGHIVELIVEKIDSDIAMGTTREYLSVRVPLHALALENVRVGDIVEYRFEDVESSSITESEHHG